jgi:hypothetical protein
LLFRIRIDPAAQNPARRESQRTGDPIDADDGEPKIAIEGRGWSVHLNG